MSNVPLISPERAEETLARFSELVRAVEEFAGIQARRTEGFRDATDRDSPDEMSSVRTLASQSGMLVRGSCEHLLAFVRCAQEPRLTIAPFACVRAGLESSAIAAWIADQRADRSERIARSLALRFEGLTQQLKSADPNQPAEKAGVENRIAEVNAKATRMGYPPFRDRTGAKITNVGTPWLGSVGTIAASLGMEKEYRLLSAVAHAHNWAISKFSYRPTEQAELHVLHIRPEALVWLCTIGARSLAAAVWNTSELLNAETAATQNLLDGLYEDLSLTYPRPWR